MKTYPTLRIGIASQDSKHIRLAPHDLSHRCLDILTAISRGGRTARCVALSTLAEGPSRPFAEAALLARYRLDVILPGPSEDYEKTFTDKAAILQTYRPLLARAASVTALADEMSAPRAAASAADLEIARLSDILVVVWNGEGETGDGGLADTISAALTAGTPIVWIDAEGRRPRRVLMPPGGEAAPFSLARYRSRAIHITPRRLTTMSAQTLTANAGTEAAAET